MTIVRHELRRGRTSLIIWTGVIGFLLAICVFLYPEMKKEMGQISETFASMGAFTSAFGMDKLDFGTLVGYYAIECGNVLGLGGAFFASICALGMLSKEERQGTAEFLLTHPVKRTRIVSEKLAALMIQVVAMNVIVFGVSVASMAAVGEAVPWREVCLLHAAYLFMQAEIASVCFGISAFVGRGGVGIGIGVAALAYFLNIVANITSSAEFLKYVTPFGYCDGAEIVETGSLDCAKLGIGGAVSFVCIAAAHLKYRKKDVR